MTGESPGAGPSSSTSDTIGGWLASVGLSVDEAALIVAVVALLATALPGVRRRVFGLAGRMASPLRRLERRYANWFVGEYGTLRNIYLEHPEELGLTSTYVPLALYSRERETRVAAAHVLADAANQRLLITGDPGTGKSTLLRAFGTGVLRQPRSREAAELGLKDIAVSREIPFLVPLRDLAKHLDQDRAHTLASYLDQVVFRRDAKLVRGRELLARLLRDERCLVLLDGLDEVSAARYPLVRDAVLDFVNDDSDEMPTQRARVVLTCRRQNLLKIADDWLPRFVDRPYVLAALRDSDISRFARKRARDFVPPRTFEAFWGSLEQSGTIELHRVPLILTISLGLYIKLDAYTIPSSVARFYDEIIRQLLLRHDFRLDKRAVGENRYSADDKYRYLRFAALAMAERPDEFEEFQHEELVSCVAGAQRYLYKVPVGEAAAFVDEIIDRSGLLGSISREDRTFVFQHKSLQEYLTAAELARTPEAAVGRLLARAADPEWRQVLLFFATLDHVHVEGFVRALLGVSPELAGHCIGAGAIVDDALVAQVLEALVARVQTDVDVAEHLSAVMSMSRSPRSSVRDPALVAVERVLGQLAGRADLMELLNLDDAGALQLLDSVAATRSKDIVPMVPRLASLLSPDDPRLVGPLWKSLSTPGLEQLPDVAAPICTALLTLAYTERGLRELENLPSFAPAFADDELRASVYPFRHGVDPQGNLVTLLCWRRHLEVSPEPPNKFLLAAEADPVAFAQVERDSRRRLVSVSAFLVGRTVLVLTTGATLATLVVQLFREGWSALFPGPSWWSLLLLVPPVVLSSLAAGAIAEVGDRRGVPALLLQSSDDSANPVVVLADDFFLGISGGTFYWDSDTFTMCVVTAVPLSAVTLAVAGAFPGLSAVGLIGLAAVVQLVGFWLPALRAFTRGRRWYLRRPNRYVDVYDDPQSRHWVTAEA